MLTRDSIVSDPRFSELEPLEKRVFLASPTMHGPERDWIDEAFDTNWITTAGSNIQSIEETLAEYVGVKYAVALSSGTSALHLATKLAGERLYGQARPNHGTLEGHKVFCSDVTFDASVNPVAYEDGEAVFIDTEYDTWNMDPVALSRAFELYPDVRLIVIAHLYGTPGKMKEIKEIADSHNAFIIEDAAESLGAKYKIGNKWYETGSIGNYNCISFNGNKIITGSSGGMFLTDSKEDAEKVRKWSTQSRENAQWYQHEEIGYNYRMSNVIAGVVRGQIPYLSKHIDKKRKIYERYRRGFEGLPVSMNPYDAQNSKPNYWLSCMLIDKRTVAPMTRGDKDYLYERKDGCTCPHEILDALNCMRCEGRPIWKPMHMQPIYRTNLFVKSKEKGEDIGADIFHRGLCLPSDIKMTEEEQDFIIDVIRRCFR